MHPLVQSAFDAANQGDKPKAIELVRQALTTNPNDVEAWLVLAAVVDDPQRRRQCLNRVLTIDPTNQIARDELLDMDRGYMSAAPSQPVAESVSTVQAQPEPVPYSSSAFTYESAPAIEQTEFPAQPAATPKTPQPKPASKPQTEKPQVFRYSWVTQIITYVFFALFSCATLIGFMDLTAAIVPCGLALVMLPVIWIISAQVEVSEKGIRASQLYGLTSSYVGWEGIASIKSNSMQQNLQLITRKGNSIKVSSQLSGYPIIIEILRRKRPDLFNAAPAMKDSAGYQSSPSLGSVSSAAAFTGTKTFSKNFFRQYGILFIVIPFCFFAVWTTITTPENRVGASIAAVFCGIMILIPFFQVSSVKVEPDKLTIETTFEEKVFSARDIKEIKMQSVRGRYGRVTNFVNIIPVKGKNYPLQGFSDGDEIIYGILSNWWNANQSR